MRIHTMIAVLFSVMLAGCISEQEADNKTRQAFVTPIEVGTLPDGRVVYAVTRTKYVGGLANARVHTIYFVDGSPTISSNRMSGGKTPYVISEAIIDQPVDERARLKRARAALDEAESLLTAPTPND